jgi:hypothetical protein
MTAILSQLLFLPDCRFPDHEWKNSFFVKCLTPILETMVSVKQPHYNKILELDEYVQRFGVPAILDDATSHSISPRFLVMQRGLVALSREIGKLKIVLNIVYKIHLVIALLQLHRRYFMEAMNAEDPLSLHHPYSPSVIATYRGACDVISTVENLFDQEEQLCARFLHFCFNAYFAGASIQSRVFVIKIDISICRGHSPCSLPEDLPVHWRILHCKTLSEYAFC